MTARTPSDLVPILPGLLDAMSLANIGVVVFGYRDGAFEKWYANEPAMRDLGYAIEEWMTTPVFQVITEEHRNQIVNTYERIVSGGPVPVALELSLNHRDGHEVRTDAALGRVDVPGGAALVVVMRDLPGRLSKSHLSLLEADRISLVGALAAGFAHETNNPLTSVLLNLRSLRRQIIAHVPEAAQANALRCLEDITTGAERIASNVRALQTLATRSTAGEIDLAAVVSSALRLAAPTLEPHAHVIRQIFPVRTIPGEESRVGQAVLAMLLFASSGFDTEVATASNRIVVAVEERGDSIVVEVTDNGPDLSADEERHAFDPFFRTSVRGAAVGVGLGVARSVASALGGEVRLAPRPGGGAVVTMTLPTPSQGF